MKKIFGTQIWAKGVRIWSKFLEIAYNDSFQQYLTSCRDKIYKKNWGTKFGPKQPRLGFFSYFLKFGSLVFLEIAYYDILQQFLTSSRDKIRKKKIGGPNLGQNHSEN